jgi:hypothetical protein
MLKQEVSGNPGREQRGPNEERRASARRSVALMSLCRAVGGAIGVRRPARVRDLSTLGVGLVVSQQLEPGTLLEIDLETPSGRQVRTPLARVVHVEEEGDGSWAVGCAFTAELSSADLRIFRVQRLRALPWDGRRWVRFPCNVETVCATSLTTPGERSAARVLNVSSGGMGLLLPCEFEAGTLLHFQVPGSDEGPERKLLLRVIRTVEHSNGDWFHGCEFAEQLSEDVLLSWLDELPG